MYAVHAGSQFLEREHSAQGVKAQLRERVLKFHDRKKKVLKSGHLYEVLAINMAE
jgi:hypothetical protein